MVPFIDMSHFLDVSALIRDETSMIPVNGLVRCAELHRVRYSCRTTLKRELLTVSPPSSTMNPSRLNFFMKKSTFERVVPAMLCEFLARHLRQHTFRLFLHSVTGEQQERPREPLLVVIEQLVEQVFLDADVRAEHVRDEPVGQLALLVEQPNHLVLLEHEDGAQQSSRSRHPCAAAVPARQPSPKNSPGPSIATTASLPVLERTESFTPPF